LPEDRPTVTVTLEAGAAESATPNVSVNPCITGAAATVVTIAGVTVLDGVHKTLVGAALLLPHVPWKPNEVLAPVPSEPL
jgi:hypothetical protein